MCLLVAIVAVFKQKSKPNDGLPRNRLGVCPRSPLPFSFQQIFSLQTFQKIFLKSLKLRFHFASFLYERQESYQQIGSREKL